MPDYKRTEAAIMNNILCVCLCAPRDKSSGYSRLTEVRRGHFGLTVRFIAAFRGTSFLKAFFFFACEDFGKMFDHSFPACAFFCFFLSEEVLSHTNFTL